MSEFLTTEGADGSLHRLGSSLTLTNSTFPTPQSSRDSSIVRQKRSIMGQRGRLSDGATTIRRYLHHELASSGMSLVVILCFFISGIIDSVAFNSWNCFVQMQTGNTIFAALGIGGQPAASHNQQYYKSLTSIAAFCVGSLFFSALHRYPTGFAEQPSSRRRLILILSFVIQTIFIVIAAILVSEHLVSNLPFVSGVFSSGSATISSDSINFLDLCPVAILSFQAAGQVTLSRMLGMLDVPTIVLSTLYHDFTADLYSIRASWQEKTSVKDFFLGFQRRQATRFLCIVALFSGGIVGGETYKVNMGMAIALWVAAFLKLFITLCWVFWPRDKTQDLEEEQLPR